MRLRPPHSAHLSAPTPYTRASSCAHVFRRAFTYLLSSTSLHASTCPPGAIAARPGSWTGSAGLPRTRRYASMSAGHLASARHATSRPAMHSPHRNAPLRASTAWRSCTSHARTSPASTRPFTLAGHHGPAARPVSVHTRPDPIPGGDAGLLGRTSTTELRSHRPPAPHQGCGTYTRTRSTYRYEGLAASSMGQPPPTAR